MNYVIILLTLIIQLNDCLSMNVEERYYCIWDTTMEVEAILDEIQQIYILNDY